MASSGIYGKCQCNLGVVLQKLEQTSVPSFKGRVENGIAVRSLVRKDDGQESNVAMTPLEQDKGCFNEFLASIA